LPISCSSGDSDALVDVAAEDMASTTYVSATSEL
jgi:hypothetical protein